MKKYLTTLLALIAIVATAQAAEVPLLGNVYARQATLLNGDWKYIVDVQEEGYYDYRMNLNRWGFFQNAKPQRPEDLIEYDFDKAPKMQIPSDWNTKDEHLFLYEGTVWFKKSFTYHKQEGQHTLLYFGAVNYDCHVYVNTKHVTHHIGGFTPFNIVSLRLLIISLRCPYATILLRIAIFVNNKFLQRDKTNVAMQLTVRSFGGILYVDSRGKIFEERRRFR